MRDNRFISNQDQFDATLRDEAAKMPKKWRESFTLFVHNKLTGKQEKRFLKWFEENKKAQRAMERVLRADKNTEDFVQRMVEEEGYDAEEE